MSRYSYEESKLQIELVNLFKTKIENNNNNFHNLNKEYKIVNTNTYIASNINEDDGTVQSGVRLNKMGRLAGEGDLIIYYKHPEFNVWCYFYVELKTQKNYATKNNGLNDNQIKFQDKCSALNIPYFVVCKPSMFLEVLEKMNIIKEKRE